MEKNLTQFLASFFFNHFPRKAVALFSAIIIWFLVNHTLTATKTLPQVPVRIIHLPPNKTVVGLQPHGILNKKIAVTLRGQKSAVENLSQNDLEILINAAGKEDSFIAKIEKKNLYLLSHDEPLKKKITEVSAADIFIKISDLVTEEIPVTITAPIGEPPSGFHYLDISPKQLMQKVSGPKEEVIALKQKGLQLTFDLDKIQESELAFINSMQGSLKNDEVTFFIPQVWKKVAIPFKNCALENLNDPKANYLHIDLLKKEHIFLETKLPITIFYPAEKLDSFNPESIALGPSPLVTWHQGVPLLTLPLYVGGVSLQFLEIVKDKIQIALFPKEEQTIGWSLVFIDEKQLEALFLQAFQNAELNNKYTEEALRKRFCHYLHTFELFTEGAKPLQLNPHLEGKQITLSP